jgi:hypothetical protein
MVRERVSHTGLQTVYSTLLERLLRLVADAVDLLLFDDLLADRLVAGVLLLLVHDVLHQPVPQHEAWPAQLGSLADVSQLEHDARACAKPTVVSFAAPCL